MKPFRCQICDDTYLGDIVPDRCPFCGVLGKYLVNAAEWINYGAIEMSGESYNFCREALRLELKNTAFYECCVENADNYFTQAIFRRLEKQEDEHVELICNMMGIKEPDLPDESCHGSDEENFQEAHRREKEAMTFYLKVAEEAPELRVKEVFRSLAEAEGEHLKTANLYG